jgi:hypothetical protein
MGEDDWRLCADDPYGKPKHTHIVFINYDPERVEKCRAAKPNDLVFAMHFDSVEYASIMANRPGGVIDVQDLIP